MKNHAFLFSALFIIGALFPLPEFAVDSKIEKSPAPRHLEEIVYHKKNNALYLFGGAELKASVWTEPDDLFEYTNGWRLRNEKGPIGRRGHVLLYDERADMILLIGGVCQTRSGADSVLFDVWAWNGSWKALETKCPVKEPKGIYDPNQNRVLIYGDAHNLSKSWSGGDETRLELWELRSGKWKKLSNSGPADSSPLTYNKKNKSLTTLQWKDSNTLVLWEWRGAKWKTREFSSNIPTERRKYAFGYSSTENALLILGGVDSKRDLLGDFWKFDGTTWTKVESNSTPSARASLRFIDCGNRTLLFGGVTKSGLTNELWEFKNNAWTKQ